MRRVTSAADLAPACPKCHAQPGQPCGWKGAVYPGVIHRERKRSNTQTTAEDFNSPLGQLTVAHAILTGLVDPDG